jgi:hypothetical protein
LRYFDAIAIYALIDETPILSTTVSSLAKVSLGFRHLPKLSDCHLLIAVPLGRAYVELRSFILDGLETGSVTYGLLETP